MCLRLFSIVDWGVDRYGKGCWKNRNKLLEDIG